MWGTRPLPSGERAVEAPAAVMYEYIQHTTIIDCIDGSFKQQLGETPFTLRVTTPPQLNNEATRT